MGSKVIDARCRAQIERTQKAISADLEAATFGPWCAAPLFYQHAPEPQLIEVVALLLAPSDTQKVLAQTKTVRGGHPEPDSGRERG